MDRAGDQRDVCVDAYDAADAGMSDVPGVAEVPGAVAMRDGSGMSREGGGVTTDVHDVMAGVLDLCGGVGGVGETKDRFAMRFEEFRKFANAGRKACQQAADRKSLDGLFEILKKLFPSGRPRYYLGLKELAAAFRADGFLFLEPKSDGKYFICRYSSRIYIIFETVMKGPNGCRFFPDSAIFACLTDFDGTKSLRSIPLFDAAGFRYGREMQVTFLLCDDVKGEGKEGEEGGEKEEGGCEKFEDGEGEGEEGKNGEEGGGKEEGGCEKFEEGEGKGEEGKGGDGEWEKFEDGEDVKGAEGGWRKKWRLEEGVKGELTSRDIVQAHVINDLVKLSDGATPASVVHSVRGGFMAILAFSVLLANFFPGLFLKELPRARVDVQEVIKKLEDETKAQARAEAEARAKLRFDPLGLCERIPGGGEQCLHPTSFPANGQEGGQEGQEGGQEGQEGGSPFVTNFTQNPGGR